MYLARTRNLDTLDEVALLVATRLDARRAGPQAAAACKEVLDQRRKRFQWMRHQIVDGALADQVDAVAGQKYRDFEPGCDAPIGDGEGHRRKLVISSMCDDHNQVS